MNTQHNNVIKILEDASSLGELMSAVDALEKNDTSRELNWGVSSSVTMSQFGLHLRKYGLLSNTKINVFDGNYDDPLGDIDLFLKNNVDHAILLPFFDNLMPSFEAQLACMSEDLITSKEAELRGRYRLALQKGGSMKVIFLCTLHSMSPLIDFSGNDVSRAILNRFNLALREEARQFPNVRVIDTEDILGFIGYQRAFDSRFYFRSKAPYTLVFLDELAKRVSLATRGFGSHFYKALILDCDNTLWGGVIGEDLLSGIGLDKHDYPGNIFWKIQNEILALEKSGALLCLCSKNNLADVDEVLEKHPSMVIREGHLAVKKVNWEDKASNIRSLSQELNIGLDSMVFLDDSSFECEAVRQQLPMVKTFQVPKNLSDYPGLFSEIKKLFLAGGVTEESKSKTLQYRQRSEAEALKAQFENQDEYLASLGLKVELSLNLRSSIPRISELSMKSNQFNLTTTRYSEVEILSMMDHDNFAVYSLVVSDKFGNAGLTGVVIVKYEGDKAVVDNFYMSCRVIGRGVEMVIWHQIIANAINRGCTQLHAKYLNSAKNSLVNDFYDRLGLPVVDQFDAGREYSVSLTDFSPPPTSWITTEYVE
jgi:FkbH-like protein